MNQLMLELYQQALEFAYKNISKESWNTDNFHAVVSGKFAELIVRECVKEIEFQYGGGSDQPMDNEWDRAIECVSSMVKYRFGVEE